MPKSFTKLVPGERAALALGAAIGALLLCAGALELYGRHFEGSARAINQVGEHEPMEIRGYRLVLTPAAEANVYIGESTKSSQFYAPDPDLGYALNPKPRVAQARFSRGGTVHYKVQYTIGESGFRYTGSNPKENDVALFLGDSFIFGDGVNDADTIPWLYSSLHPKKWSSLNFGIPGWSLQHLLRFLELGRERPHTEGKKVRAVAILVPSTFFYRLERQRVGFLAYKFDQQEPQFAGIQRAPMFFCNLALCRYLKGALISAAKPAQLAPAEAADQAARLLAKMQKIVRERYDTQLTLVAFGPAQEPPHPQLQEALTSRGLRLHFVRIPSSAQEPATIPFDGHLAPRGNRQLAEAFVGLTSD